MVNEAFLRVLDRRQWPDDRDVVGFFCGVIRSVASDWLRPPEESDEGGERVLSDDAGPEEHFATKKFLEALFSRFSEDKLAVSIVIGMIKGREGSEIIDELNVTKLEYESKRKYVNRTIDKIIQGME